MQNATIYTQDNGETMAEGLQTCEVSDEAIDAAISLASQHGRAMILDDADGSWLVGVDGDVDDYQWPQS